MVCVHKTSLTPPELADILTYTHSVSVMVFNTTFNNISASSGGVKLVLWTQTIFNYNKGHKVNNFYINGQHPNRKQIVK
jgi:hypothetical protein